MFIVILHVFLTYSQPEYGAGATGRTSFPRKRNYPWLPQFLIYYSLFRISPSP